MLFSLERNLIFRGFQLPEMGWNSATILTCPLQLNLVWCCEQEEWKARHLLRAFKDIPVFENMKDLNKPAARDWRSGQFLPVQQVKGL